MQNILADDTFWRGFGSYPYLAADGLGFIQNTEVAVNG